MSENAPELYDQTMQGKDRWSKYLLSFLKRLKPKKTKVSDAKFLDRIWPFNQAHKKIGSIDDALKRFEERNPPIIER